MNIGFDAKRYYFNRTGLGNYSRSLLDTLILKYPDHHYFLFSPKAKSEISQPSKPVHTIVPQGFIDSLFPSFWRSQTSVKDINNHVELYHGLSNELPFGIHRSGVKTVVTIHDLIFERFPNQYRKTDVAIYRKKCRYACEVADLVVATSESTKRDIIAYYGIDVNKIEVCYQSCDSRFKPSGSNSELDRVRHQYQLPERYLLSVGSVIERKNLLNVIKALELLDDKSLGIVIVGKGKEYAMKVKKYIQEKKLSNPILWLEEGHPASKIQSDLAHIYQMALALVYPSIYEGFGIPVLEAMKCNCPVITSKNSSMEEITGDTALHINPKSVDELSAALSSIISNTNLRQELISKAQARAKRFSNELHAEKLMLLYKNLMNK